MIFEELSSCSLPPPCKYFCSLIAKTLKFFKQTETNHTLPQSSHVFAMGYKASSFTWPVTMQIYWKKKTQKLTWEKSSTSTGRAWYTNVDAVLRWNCILQAVMFLPFCQQAMERGSEWGVHMSVVGYNFGSLSVVGKSELIYSQKKNDANINPSLPNKLGQ